MKFRVSLNITSCVKERPTGIGNYIRALVAEFADDPAGIDFRLGVRPQRYFERHLAADLSARHGRIRPIVKPYRLFLGRTDVLHSLGAWLPEKPVRFKRVVTIHDLSTLDDPAAAGREWSEGRARKLDQTLERADFVITPSEFTRQRLIERLGFPEAQVRAVHHGVDPEVYRAPPPEQAARTLETLGLSEPFLLAVGDSPTQKNPGMCRKNSANLIHAFGRSKAREEARLVFFGARQGPTEAMRSAILEHGLESRVTILPYITREQLLALYSTARLFVFPSLYEGFGLPLLEALALGVPAAAARTTSLPEVGGDCVSYFDPRSVEEMAHVIDLLTSNTELARKMADRGRLRAQAFTWKKAAAETIQVYRAVTEG